MPGTETATQGAEQGSGRPAVPGQSPVRRRGRVPFHRPVDYLIAVFVLVASLVTSITLWQRSDSHNTTLDTGPAAVAQPAQPTAFPPSLFEAWERPSDATQVPVVAGPTVVTANGGAVIGRDPITGDQRWSYTRDLPLCTVSAAWNYVLAVYQRSGCNEVTALDDTTGARGPQRNGDAQPGAELVADGTYVTTTGPTLLDTWRSDLVQTMQYGKVPDFQNPNRQPYQDCVNGSVAASSGQVGVIQRCPNDSGDRLTVYKSSNSQGNADTPQLTFSILVGAHGARLVALNSQYAAVVLPDPSRLAVFNASNGALVKQYSLDLPAADLAGDPPHLVVPTQVGPDSVYWFTGSSTVALSTTDFHPQWTVNDTLGAGTEFAGRYLAPVPNALLVLDLNTGAKVGEIGVDRHGYTGAVAMAALGPVVFEQRGNTLAALR
ncbi:MAG TPA: hypothetical protein VG317_17495 [Pseudonocardiaceae bacterium]|nr:hypothetical protein [Pseudonocardiaceae bacterium]